MYLIKQYLITNKAIRKIIKYILKSNYNAYQIGFEFSLLYYFIYEDQKNYNNNINISVKNFLFKALDEETKLEILKWLSPIINYNKFFKKFNDKLLNINMTRLSSFFRGYYINNLNLYGTNIIINQILDTENYQICNDFSIYFVLYDFHNIYLDFIYHKIINMNHFPCKIKYLIASDYDKYSINEITDDINYRLVFIHKKKYYNNSIKLILNLLFYNVVNTYSLNNEEELKLYKIYNIFNKS
jgi:hypothetical protein